MPGEKENHLAFLASIVASSDDAIMSKTLDGRITSWNPAAERLFGYSAEEAVGRPMTLIFPEGAEQEEASILERIGRGEFVNHFQTRRRRKDGSLVDVSVTISPILDPDGRIVGASKIARDITELKRGHEELQRHRDHLEDLVAARTAEIAEANRRLRDQQTFIATIADNIPVMVGYWDAGQRLQFGNKAYLERFGLTAATAYGRTIASVLGQTDYREKQPMIEAALSGETQFFEQSDTMEADGRVRYHQVHYIPDRREGQVRGLFVLITDITRLKQAEMRLLDANEQLADALEEARAADAAKSRFLANMSHEIRTPMNSVLGFLGLALEGDLPPSTRKQLAMAHSSAKSLLLLINDILDISKLQSGRIDLETVPFDLPVVLGGCLELFQIRAREKKLGLSLEYHPDLPRHFQGDPMRIRQIATNLIGNAIKFTEAGHVQVSVKPASRTGVIALAVTDTGIGMTAQQMDRIFNPFVQADSSTTRRFGGTGLGVSICRQLAEAMGGRIEVESVPDQGSVFRVLLPLPVADGVAPSDDAFTTDTRALSPRKFSILLVDDIEENIELGEARLKGQGHDVTCARSGQEALDLALSLPFDVILMDVHMPGISGLDATREIRRCESGGETRRTIIALTASVMPAEQGQCFAAGMDAFIGKPIDFSELFRLMEQTVPPDRGSANAISARPAAGPIAMPARPGTGASVFPFVAVPGIDLTDGLRRWNDPARYIAALTSFRERYGDATARLLALVTHGDWFKAREIAHALKGVSGNLSLSDVYRISGLLNEALKAKDADAAQHLISDLAQAQSVAALSIAQLRRDPVDDDGNRDGFLAPDAECPLTDEAARELLAALQTDDPGSVEPLLDELSRNYPQTMLKLRSLIGDYDFDEARSLVQKRHAGGA